MAVSTEGSTNEAPTHRQAKPPAEATLKQVLGSAWDLYRAAIRGLATLDLEPEFYRYGSGWTVRFQVDQTTACALYLTRSVIGLVSVGARAAAALREDPKRDEKITRLVSASPRKGGVRWVKIPLRLQEDVRRFLTLVEISVRVQRGEEAVVSHTPRRRTSSAGTNRKKSDTPPRRSAARRSSRD